MVEVDFVMVQTSSFIGDDRPRTQQVLAAAERLFNIGNARSIQSPVGLAHVYDLTHSLARTINQAGPTDRATDRQALKRVRNYGILIKRYAWPLDTVRDDALADSDVIINRFEVDGAIVPLARKRK